MSTRTRRSLGVTISTSKKVNALSDRALILYLLTISHLDDEGFIDADPRSLKSAVVPLRDNIQIQDISGLTDEICHIHDQVASRKIPLWVVHTTSEGDFIQDPVFHEHQSFRGIRRMPSKIKDVVDRETKGCQSATKKLSQEEGKEDLYSKDLKEEGEGEESENKMVFTQHTPEKLMELFNAVTQYLPKVTEIGKGRRYKIKTRVKEGKNNLAWWKTVFEKAEMILIPGKDGRKDWFPNFDWLIDNDRNAVKVFEGNYDDARRPSGHPNGKSRKSDTPPLDPDERRLWEAEKRLRPDPDETAPESP